MTTKIQTSWTPARSKIIACIGDSLTHNNTLGTCADEFYTEQAAVALRALGCNVKGVNFGSSGDTTGQMLSRVSKMTLQGTPTVAVIYGGINDAQYATTVQASPSPTSTVFTVGAGLGTNYKPGTYITVGGVTAQILSVATDAITLTAALPGGAPAAGTAVAIDTQTNLTQIGLYIKNTIGCSRIIVGGMHYYNFSSGGDTVGTPLPANVTLRAKQSAAATAIGAVYVNFWQVMADRITAGTDTQGSYSWHVLDSNVHLNGWRSAPTGKSSGESILAAAIVSAIQAQSGWVAALT